jgi:SAM-dependent methyltransferase
MDRLCAYLNQGFNRLKARYEFYPGIIGMLLNPFYISRRGLLREVSALSRMVSGSVLDIGCGEKPYERLFHCDKYVGMELGSCLNRQTKKADIFYDGKHIPAKDNFFDSVVMFEVLEHVFNADGLLKEVRRVLKPGGLLLMSVPFIWDEHEQPYDWGRYSSFGLNALVSRNEFKVLKQQKSVTGIAVVFQLLNAYLDKLKMMRRWYVRLLISISVIFLVNLIGQILKNLLPDNSALYLDNILLAKKEQ